MKDPFHLVWCRGPSSCKSPSLVPSKACTTVVRAPHHSQAGLPAASPSPEASHSMQRGGTRDDGTSGLSTCGMTLAAGTQGRSRTGEGRRAWKMWGSFLPEEKQVLGMEPAAL